MWLSILSGIIFSLFCEADLGKMAAEVAKEGVSCSSVIVLELSADTTPCPLSAIELLNVGSLVFSESDVSDLDMLFFSRVKKSPE